MDVERLKDVALFKGLSREELQRLARWSDEVDVEAGQHLVEQGEFGHEFFVIEEGTADVLVDGKSVDTLGPDEFFGEIALLETERRIASVIARTPLRAIVMHERAFRSMEETMPAVAERISQAMRERLANR
jgi:CRP/FNR family transcriptional regulator, cyclic AMP receptor protein